MTSEESLKHSNIFQAKKNSTIKVRKLCGNMRKKQLTLFDETIKYLSVMRKRTKDKARKVG